MDKQIQDELAKVSRRIDTMQTSMDILNKDRNILEDILSRLSAVEHALHLNKDHQTEMQKDIKQEIREAGAIVENTVHDMSNKIDNSTMIVKTANGNILTKIMKKLGGEK